MSRASHSDTGDVVHATACFLGISLSFVVYTVLQERLMAVGFGDKGEKFTWSLFIVFCNRCLTSLTALFMLSISRSNALPVAPLHSYALVSLGNLVASTCQYDSLKYVTAPVQALAKCCKMLPVMAWGFLMGHKQYSIADVSVAGFVMLGCTSFVLTGSTLVEGADEARAGQLSLLGFSLLFMYLVFDGFTSTWQDKLFSNFDMDTSNQILYTALCSTSMSMLVLLVTNEMTAASAFLRRHPEASAYILAVSTVATIIQYFASYTIRVYGALAFATLMTARQFCSIIASCVIFKHRLSVGQWTGAIVVFIALGFKAWKRTATAQPGSIADVKSRAVLIQASPVDVKCKIERRHSVGLTPSRVLDLKLEKHMSEDSVPLVSSRQDASQVDGSPFLRPTMSTEVLPYRHLNGTVG